MAITLIKRPDDFARVNDTNRCTYEFSSTNWTQPNFQFYFNLRYYETNGTQKDLGNYKVFPISGGTVQFNPTEIYRNYLEHELNISSTGLVECSQMAKKFQLFVYEYYGTPPTKILTGNWYESTPTTFYIGCQQDIPYDYIPLNPSGNTIWVMSSGGRYAHTGFYLTDANRYELDNDDYLFLYCLGNNIGGRPDRIRYKIYHWDWVQGGALPDGPTYGLTPPNSQSYTENTQMSLPLQTQYGVQTGGGNGTGGGVPLPGFHSAITYDILYDTNISFSYVNSRAYYFPCGPFQAINYSQVLSGYTNKWVYYEIDIMTGNTVLNSRPMQVFKKAKCNKYDKWQMFWLNPHGGFDTFVFSAKKDIEYKIKRDTYKQKLNYANYTPYQAGEKVFNIESVESTTIRTTNLTQMEAQLLIQMVQSDVVYALRTFNYNGAYYPYGVPYIIESDPVKYPIKRNDKEIFMEVKIRPANNKIIQKM